MTDTSASALLKLAARLAADDDPDGIIAADPDAVDKFLASTDTLFSDIDRTLRALAAERAQPPADVVERVARIIDRTHSVIVFSDGSRAPVPPQPWAMEQATAALSALRPGDEVPAGVVVPREMTEEMIEAAFAVRARLEPIGCHPVDEYRAVLSALNGGEQPATKPHPAKTGGLVCPRCSQDALVVDDPRSNCMYCENCGAGVEVRDGGGDA